MLLPGVALIVAVPLVATPEADSTLLRLVATLPGLVVFVLPVWFSVYMRRGENLEARDAVLDPVRQTAESRGIVSLLGPDRNTSGFYARNDVRKALTAWLDTSGTPVGVWTAAR